jgi:hypothetical protein
MEESEKMTYERVQELLNEFYRGNTSVRKALCLIVDEVIAGHVKIESEPRCHILQLEQRFEDSQRKVEELSRDAEPPAPESTLLQRKRREDTWEDIRKGDDNHALFLVCFLAAALVGIILVIINERD